MRPILAMLLIALTLTACQQNDDPATGLPQSSFIDVIVRLRKATREDPDPAAFAARKQQILRDANVTDEQLRAYLKAHERDLDHMAAVWESINVRLADPTTM